MIYESDPTTKPNRPTPALADGITGPVIVPFLQSVVTGLLLGIVAGVIVSMTAASVPAWKIFLIAWTGGTLASWLIYRARWQYVIEQVLGVDLNHDGIIGAPVYSEPPPVQLPPLRVVLEQDQGRSLDFIDLPHPEKLPELAAGLLQGRTFAQDSFAYILKRDEFNEIRNELIARNLARWKVQGAPQQGAELTPAGRAVMKRIAESHTPTLPERI